MSAMEREVLAEALGDLEKARDALQFSFQKCSRVRVRPGLDFDELERFEALTSRFARLSDLVTQRILRLLDAIDLEEPGTVRDRINRAEKRGLIDSAEDFVEIRVLRNEIAHEYKADTVYSLFESVLSLTPTLIDAAERIVAHGENLLRSG